MGPGNYSDNILIPPWVFFSGLANGLSAVLNGTFGLDTARWNAAGFGVYGGYGYVSIGAASVSIDFSASTNHPTVYIYNIPTVGSPHTVLNASTNSTVNIRNSELFSFNGTGGTYRFYQNVFSGGATFTSSTGNNIAIRCADLAVGGPLVLDSHTGTGTITAYLGATQFYSSSTLTINGTNTHVTMPIDSFPVAANITFLNGAVDGTNLILNNEAIRTITGGTGVTATTTNGNTSLSANLTAGTNVTFTGTAPNITINAAGGGGTTININRTAFYDRTNGVDASGVVGDPSHPYKTFAAAYSGLYAAGFCRTGGLDGVIYMQPCTGNPTAVESGIILQSYLTVVGQEAELCLLGSINDTAMTGLMNVYFYNVTITGGGTFNQNNNIFNFIDCNFVQPQVCQGSQCTYNFLRCSWPLSTIVVGPGNQSVFNFTDCFFSTSSTVGNQNFQFGGAGSGTRSIVNVTGCTFQATVDDTTSGNISPYLNIAGYLDIRLNANKYYYNAFVSNPGILYGLVDGIPNLTTSYLTSQNETMTCVGDFSGAAAGTFAFLNCLAATTNYNINMNNFSLDITQSKFATVNFFGSGTSLGNIVIQNSVFNGLWQVGGIMNLFNFGTVSYTDNDCMTQSAGSYHVNTENLVGSTGVTNTVYPYNAELQHLVVFAPTSSTLEFHGTLANFGSRQYYIYATQGTVAVTSSGGLTFTQGSTNVIPLYGMGIMTISNTVGQAHLTVLPGI